MRVVCDSKKIDEVIGMYNVYINSYGIKASVTTKKLSYIDRRTKNRVDVYDVSSKLKNVELIARYNMRTHNWDGNVPEEVQDMHGDTCWMCHSRRERNNVVLIKVDDEYHSVGENCYSRLNIDEWLKAFKIVEFDSRDYINDSDSDDRERSSSYWDIREIYNFVKNYQGIFFSNNARRYAVVDIDNRQSYMERINSHIGKDGRASVSEINDFYRYCQKNATTDYGRQIKEIVDDILEYRKEHKQDYVHKIAVPMIIAAIRAYFETELYKEVGNFDSSVEVIDCNATLKFADVSKTGNYRYIFVTEDNQLIEYYTSVDLEDKIGENVHIKTKSIRTANVRGKTIARVKRLRISK